LCKLLEDSRKVFHEAAAGISESQASTSPGEGRWSVLQCTEHVTIVEERFLGFLENAGRLILARNPIQPKRPISMARVTNRTTRGRKLPSRSGRRAVCQLGGKR